MKKLASYACAFLVICAVILGIVFGFRVASGPEKEQPTQAGTTWLSESVLDYQFNSKLQGIVIKGLSEFGKTKKEISLRIPQTLEFEKEQVRVIGFENSDANGAFFENDNIVNLKIDADLETVDGVFAGSKNLKSIVFEGEIDEITSGSFKSCRELENVVFKGKVGLIGSSAFEDCENISQLEFAAEVGIISGAFAGLKLNSLIFASDVSIIEAGAFAQISGFNSVIFEKTVERISGGAFDGATIRNVEFLEKINEITASFNELPLLSTIGFADDVGKIDGSFKLCTALETLVIDVNIGQIASGAFDNCTALRMLEFNGSIKVIKSSFKNAKIIRSLVFNADVDRLEDGAFENGFLLQNIVFNGKLKEFGMGVFGGCLSLDYLYFPSSLETVEAPIFAPNLEKIFLGGQIKSGFVSNWNELFGSTRQIPFVQNIAGTHADDLISKITLGQRHIALVGSLQDMNDLIAAINEAVETLLKCADTSQEQQVKMQNATEKIADVISSAPTGSTTEGGGKASKNSKGGSGLTKREAKIIAISVAVVVLLIVFILFQKRKLKEIRG